MVHTLVLSAVFRRHLLLFLLIFFTHPNILTRAADGRWDLLLSNIGISAMHMQLLHTDRVVMFDRTDFGRSNISLPDGKCRRDPNDTVLPVDCTAHSVEYDVASNSIRHSWNSTCDWREISRGLTQRRWYATNHILPDGRQIVIGGRRQFNYEFYPKTSSADGSYNLPFLVQTNDPRIENNLYPFVFLNGDGNLFIFANNRAILFNYLNGSVVRTYPTIPGGDPRSYPSTGSAVLLPLKNNAETEVLVCGGAPKGAYVRANNGDFVGALNTCGRIRINDLNPQWVMETMPMGRVMSDMLLLPSEINGAGLGTAGWELGRSPVLAPVIYRPDNPVGSRFEVQNPSSTPRMYHSTAVLLRDGRVLVGGSNPHTYYNFTGVLFPTDLTLQAFSPRYLDPKLEYSDPILYHPFHNLKSGTGNNYRSGSRFLRAIGSHPWGRDSSGKIHIPSSGRDTWVGQSRTNRILPCLCGSSRYSKVRVFGSRSGE
ncbi:UNVERIFIED_CONTAM: Aldehyde oxidase GLOX [Sesamum calycinum]|uniref:Aldehyde oxidase GLOX n=1 Tax=Sesamum calycinum TaxID=2727403 RepID=A0AAW2P7K2_9LAMI